MLVKRLDYIKRLSDLYLTKNITKKEVKKLLNNIEYMLFNKIVELEKKQKARLINRKIKRTLLIEYIDSLHLKELQLDYVGDVLDLHSQDKTTASRKQQRDGEINSKCVGVRLKNTCKVVA